MRDVRLVHLSDDGTHLLLTHEGSGEEFALKIDDRLRGAVVSDRARQGSAPLEKQSRLRPKEIQARLRAGESSETVAAAAEVPIERILRYAGPVLAEREYTAGQARRCALRRNGREGPAQILDEAVGSRLDALGIGRDHATWDAWRTPRDAGRSRSHSRSRAKSTARCSATTRSAGSSSPPTPRHVRSSVRRRWTASSLRPPRRRHPSPPRSRCRVRPIGSGSLRRRPRPRRTPRTPSTSRTASAASSLPDRAHVRCRQAGRDAWRRERERTRRPLTRRVPRPERGAGEQRQRPHRRARSRRPRHPPRTRRPGLRLRLRLRDRGRPRAGGCRAGRGCRAGGGCRERARYRREGREGAVRSRATRPPAGGGGPASPGTCRRRQGQGPERRTQLGRHSVRRRARFGVVLRRQTGSPRTERSVLIRRGSSSSALDTVSGYWTRCSARPGGWQTPAMRSGVLHRCCCCAADLIRSPRPVAAASTQPFEDARDGFRCLDSHSFRPRPARRAAEPPRPGAAVGTAAGRRAAALPLPRNDGGPRAVRRR